MNDLTFRPLNYDLTYTVDLEKFVFSCIEKMTFTVVGPTKEIVLDCQELAIDSCMHDDKKLQFVLDGKNHTLTIQLTEELNPIGSGQGGEYQIEIHFSGEYKDQHAGWYRATYTEEGKTKYFVTSHFEAQDAKRALPCVDHPNYKATFSVSYILSEHLDGLSNMPIISEEKLGDGTKKIVFGQSPKMSTYLLYLGAGEFEFLEDRYKNVLIRGVATNGKSQYTRFAIDVTKKTLAYLDEYFDTPYPLPKMDLIADPDFAMGAMEQWGAITFREARLLVYPGKTSLAALQRCAETVAHELVHQWFGNLVTMKWWDNLWLNESFATFMAYKVIEDMYPGWDMWTEYIEDTVFDGMGLDMLQSSHPVVQPLEKVEEVESRFDEITYDKGGSVLRMLEGFVGKEDYRKGLQIYIKNFAYANAQGEDLWNAIGKVSGKPVAQVMESFLTQTGFPAVSFARDGDKLILSQSRFTLEPNEESNPPRSHRGIWSIPILIRDEKGTVHDFLLTDKEMTVNLPDKVAAVNGEYTNFYLSNLDATVLAELHVSRGMLTDREKLGLIHDLDFLAKACLLSVEDYLATLKKFFADVEQDPSVLGYCLQRLNALYGLLPREEVNVLRLHLAKRTLDLVGKTPKENESSHIPAARIEALYTLGLEDDRDVLSFVKESFENYLTDETSLHSDLRNIIYVLAAWQSSAYHDKILELYKSHTVEEEKVKLLTALGHGKDTQKLAEVLSFALTPEVRFVNIFYLFNFQGSPTMTDPMGKVAFDWLETNWDTLIDMSGGGMGQMLLRRILKAILPTYSKKDYATAEKFLDRITTPILQQAKRELAEEMRVIARFIEKNKN